MRVRGALVAACAILLALAALGSPRSAPAIAVSAVAISPSVVPVPVSA